MNRRARTDAQRKDRVKQKKAHVLSKLADDEEDEDDEN